MEYTYLVEIDGREWPVQISDGPGGRRVRVGDGPEQAVDWSRVEESGLYSLLIDGASRQVRVAPDAEQPGTWQVSVGHEQREARVQTERERRLQRAGGQKQVQGGEVTVKAPMPGLVRAVAVAVGDEVTAGQRLVVLEAMKMENDIQSPRAGTVKAIRVAAGDTVENGRPLVVLE